MSVDDIRSAKKKTIGTNQTLKALKQAGQKVVCVYIARDAEPHVVLPVQQMARRLGVRIDWVDTMRLLGKSCGIEVEAATASILED